jgi:hypothetical protein
VQLLTYGSVAGGLLSDKVREVNICGCSQFALTIIPYAVLHKLHDLLLSGRGA